MTKENQEALIRAYKAAVAAGQSEIADMLEKVILGEMGPKGHVMRGVNVGQTEATPIKPPWNVMCGPDIVPL